MKKITFSVIVVALAAMLSCAPTLRQPSPDDGRAEFWRTEEGRVFYFSMKLVASDEELSEFMNLEKSLRAEWLSAFWTKRDPNPLTEMNEFKVEFDQRVEHALYFYWVPFGQRKPWDDRGDVYILYGEPDRIEDPAFTFIQRLGKFQEYAPGKAGAAEEVVWFYEKHGAFQFAEDTPGVMKLVVHRRSTQDAGSALAGFYRTAMDKVVLAKAEFVPDLGSPLDICWNWWRFFDGQETYNVRVNIGIPAQKLGILPDSTDKNYGWLVFEQKAVMMDKDGSNRVYRESFVRRKIPADLDRRDLLFVDQLVYDGVDPGFYNVALSVKDSVSGRTGIYQDTSVVLVSRADLAGPQKISKLIMADSIFVADSSYVQSNGMRFVRNGLVIIPRPGNVYLAGQNPKFYSEIYDLIKGDDDSCRCRTHYYIFDSEKGDGALLYQTATEQSFACSDSGVFITGELNSRALERGEYIIRVDLYDLNDPWAAKNEIRKAVAGFRIH